MTEGTFPGLGLLRLDETVSPTQARTKISRYPWLHVGARSKPAELVGGLHAKDASGGLSIQRALVMTSDPSPGSLPHPTPGYLRTHTGSPAESGLRA